MYLHKDLNSTKKNFQLRCVHYPLQHKSSLKFSDTQKFFKDDCVTETDQMQKGENNNACSCMDNPKLRTKKNSKAAVDRPENKIRFLQFKKQTTEELQQFVLPLPKPVAT